MSAVDAAPQIDWIEVARTRPRARRKDPASSHIAADYVSATGSAAAQCGFALAAVKSNPGLTSRELAFKLEIDRYVLARRLPELRDDGFIRNGGELRTCEVTGRAALTWWPL